jgi:hypothetical protein
MQVEISQINGIIKISQRINDILHKRTYIDYSKKECIADFKQYIKTIKK